MSQDIQSVYEALSVSIEKAFHRLEDGLLRIRAGKVSPTILDTVFVDYYGNRTPVQQLSNVSVADARTLLIQPWEKKMLQPIERAIQQANLGANPQNDGSYIRLTMPVLSEQRRTELVRKAYAEGENAKISVRSARRDAMEVVKKMRKDSEISEDIEKEYEGEIQQKIDAAVDKIGTILQAKEKDIMTV